MSSPSTPPAIPFTLAWQEIGRPSPEEAPIWTTWVAPLGEDGDVVYRSFVVAEGALTLAVELHPRDRSGVRTIHRARRRMPSDPIEAAERIASLLRVADEAVAKMMEADHDGAGMLEGHGSRSWRMPDPSQETARNGRSDAWHCIEHRLRERAYFLWEREGRPEGCAQEFWERACQEEARAA